MSEISDRLRQIDEQNKQAAAGDGMPVPLPEPQIKDRSSSGNNFSLAVFILVLLMGITIATLYVFSSKTIGQIERVTKISDQLEVMWDEHTEEFDTLQKHVDAMEGEFRRAFEKDRKDMAAMKEELVEAHTLAVEKMDQKASEIITEVLHFKTVASDRDNEIALLQRNIEDLTKQLNAMRQELRALRIGMAGAETN